MQINVMHFSIFFHARITSDTHHIMPSIKIAWICVSLQLPLHRPYASLEEYLQVEVKGGLEEVYVWMTAGGISMPPFGTCFEQCRALANRMHDDIISHLTGRTSVQSKQRWWKENMGMEARSGVEIKKDILT